MILFSEFAGIAAIRIRLVSLYILSKRKSRQLVTLFRRACRRQSRTQPLARVPEHRPRFDEQRPVQESIRRRPTARTRLHFRFRVAAGRMAAEIESWIRFQLDQQFYARE